MNMMKIIIINLINPNIKYEKRFSDENGTVRGKKIIPKIRIIISITTKALNPTKNFFMFKYFKLNHQYPTTN